MFQLQSDWYLAWCSVMWEQPVQHYVLTQMHFSLFLFLLCFECEVRLLFLSFPPLLIHSLPLHLLCVLGASIRNACRALCVYVKGWLSLSLRAPRRAPAFGSLHHRDVHTVINSARCNSCHIFTSLSSFPPPSPSFFLSPVSFFF